ncbi:ABC transporter ATP-binding protein [Actinoplanes sp. NPDC051861]|uniref:ABC transporter ATP-binding protein n=1 Tax=Actinoplanes sp. NPDC051861 TaxID=3155170 RepID=UPI0034229272
MTATMMTGALELRDISKRYGRGRHVLRHVDLDVRPREVAGIVGGNGSGKSTLLRIIVGLTPFTGGTLRGRPDVVGYVPERFPTAGRISARSYLAHMGRIRGMNGSDAAVRARELLGRLSLVGGPDTQLRRLSKGNAQKVAVAQALLVPPQLLVLDEPWSGLDADAHEVLADLIDEVARGGGSVIFTDHREAVVGANATTVYRVTQGNLTPHRAAGQGGPGREHGPAREHGGPVTDVAVVELVPAVRTPDEPDWRALPGVLDARRERDAVILRIEGDRCDDLLVDAIRNGWSVEAVRRGGN